ncbi:MAG: hypothetical protein HY093_00250 [Candidatus Liptonbacteria bacterium]|nr:hypothetical protein [Candidatus Liptonbacteria bacterium]
MDVSWMYQKNPRKPKLEKTRGEKYYPVIVAVIVLILTTGILGFYFSFKSKIGLVVEWVDLSRDCVKTLNSYRDGKLTISLCVKDDGTLILIWQKLSKQTASIKIYKTAAGSKTPTLWRTVAVTGETGSFDLGQEEGGPAIYTVAGADKSQKLVWVSQGRIVSSGTSGTGAGGGKISILNPGGLPTNGQTGTGPSGGSQLPGNDQAPSGQATNLGTGPGPTGQTSPLPPPPTSPLENTSTQYYYTPSGQVSGTSSIPLASFWASHVNKKIEVGWQNIPSSTTKIIVYRSKTETSGYEKF